MNFGRIRRGPMAADAFTQIRNALFRDPRISYKAKGVFGLISTHRDGYGVSAESIAAVGKDGVSSIKGALRELEAHGYLQRTQGKKPDGTFGIAVYFITDQPNAFADAPELENRRSDPSVENPPTENPPAVNPPTEKPLADEPPAENHPHKKTSSKHISRKKTLSPLGVPKQGVPEPPAGPEERENDPSTARAANVLAAYEDALGRPLFGEPRTKLLADAAVRLTAGIPLPWLCDRARELVANGWNDLAKHCDMSTVPTVRVAAATKADWCGRCDDPNHRMTRDPQRDNELVECQACHPAAVARRRRAQQGEAA